MNKAMACVYPVRLGRKRLMWEITKKCNADCKHCVTGAVDSGRGIELTLERIKEIIKEIAEFGINELYITGGEPRVRDDFFEIMEFAKNKFIMLATATNAYQLSDEYIERMSELGLAHLNLGLDHHIAKYNDEIRGFGMHDEFFKSARKLRDKNVNIILSAVITKYNSTDLEGIVRLAEQVGIRNVVFNWMMPFGRARENAGYMPSKEDYYVIVDEIKRLREKYEIKRRSVRVLYRRYVTNGMIPLEGCPGGEQYFFITNVGQLSHCSYLAKIDDESFLCGDLKKQSFSEVVKSEEFVQVRNVIVNRRERIAECKRCQVHDCGYGCPASAFAWNDTIDSVDPICNFGGEG